MSTKKKADKLEKVNQDLEKLQNKHNVKLVGQLQFLPSGVIPTIGVVDLDNLPDPKE